MLRSLRHIFSDYCPPAWRMALWLLAPILLNSGIASAQVRISQPQSVHPGMAGNVQLAQGSSHSTNKNSTKPKRPLPFPIEATPDSTEELEIIHHRSQLMITRSPIVRVAIANPDLVDVVQYSENEISIIGMAMGSTTVTLWFQNIAEPLIYLVEVIRDPSFEERLRTDFGKLEKQLQILFPNSKVYLIPLQQRLIVKGQARDEGEAAHILQIVRSAYYTEWGPYTAAYGQGFGGGASGYGDNNANDDNDNDDDEDDFIVNMLEVPGNHQVMLHVKIAEISRGQLRRLGIDLRVLFNERHLISSTLGGLPSTLTGIFENGEVSLLVNWLAGNRTARVLAAPTLTVLSGHTASFLSGGEFPVPTIVGIGGAQGTTTSFRGFGTSLLVRPEIIDRDWVKLDITPEYSQLNNANSAGGIPGLDSRRVQTTVKLREGQTIVLAGLFGGTMTTEVNRIPFFGELPLIGPKLFAAKRADHGENELLIMVTPELVRPMEPDEVPPLPGFYVTWPNDIELYHYAKTEGYPEQGVYQLSPYGWGPGYATEVGYRPFNPAPATIPLGTGVGTGFASGAGYGLGGQGYAPGFQPSAIYPGPPGMPTGNPIPVQPAPAGSPARPLQPTPDAGMGAIHRPGSIQQVGYQQQQGRSWLPWSRNTSEINPRHPAVLPTNSTTPSLESGVDARLGPNGQNRSQPQPHRGRY